MEKVCEYPGSDDADGESGGLDDEQGIICAQQERHHQSTSSCSGKPRLWEAGVIRTRNWEARSGSVSIVTQLSQDRLGRLQDQCESWGGITCAAVYCPVTTRSRRSSAAKAAVQQCRSAVEEVIRALEGSGCPVALEVVIAAEQVDDIASAGVEYPVNALRNLALSKASTDLVLLLDVDFLVSAGARDAWAPHMQAGAMLRSCCCHRELLVLPAFQVSTRTEALAASNSSKAGVVQACKEGWLTQFAASEFPQGHRATDYDRWLSERSGYAAEYEEGFEPFVVAPRRLVPWYNPCFRGYGRNKVSHLLHCAALGMPFFVLPDAWVVHVPHVQSDAFRATLGPHQVRHPNRFPRIMALYNEARQEMVHGPAAEASQCYGQDVASRRGGVAVKRMGQWMGGEAPAEEQELLELVRQQQHRPGPFLGHQQQSTSSARLKDLRQKLLNVYRHKFEFSSCKLTAVFQLDNCRQLPPGRCENANGATGAPGITLCTTTTPDRLHHLELQAKHWSGAISAAVYVPAGSARTPWSLVALRRRLNCLLEAITCCQPHGSPRLVQITVLQEQARPWSLMRMATATGRLKQEAPMVPINAMRNAAIDAAKTDLLLLLDVDLLPCPGLADELSQPPERLDAIRADCWDNKTAFVLPAFEVAARSGPSASTNYSNIRAKDNSMGTSADEVDDLGEVVVELEDGVMGLEELLLLRNDPDDNCAINGGNAPNPDGRGAKETSEVTWEEQRELAVAFSRGGARAMAAALRSGSAIPFHAAHYPRGHEPSDAEAWCRKVLLEDSSRLGEDEGDSDLDPQKEAPRPAVSDVLQDSMEEDGLCSGLRSYAVDYQEGYEPFILCSRKGLPRFDERFRGYGYDKISHAFAMHLKGYQFRVLAPAFCIDLPHPPSADRLATLGAQAGRMQHLRVTALYARARQELVVSSEAGRSALLLRHQGRGDGAAPKVDGGLQQQQTATGAREGLSLCWSGGLQEEAVGRSFDVESSWEPAGPPWTGHSSNRNIHDGRELLACSWRGSGWSFQARRGLGNCRLCATAAETSASLPRLHQVQHSTRSAEINLQDAGLLVSLPKGCWSPEATFESLGKVGGVAARAALPQALLPGGGTSTAAAALLFFELEFPPGFHWALGGALPGLYTSRGARVSFAWREGGSGQVMVQMGTGCRPRAAAHLSAHPGPAWGFSRSQRHTLGLELRWNEAVVAQDGRHRGPGSCWGLRAWVDDRLVVEVEQLPLDDEEDTHRQHRLSSSEAAQANKGAGAGSGKIQLPTYTLAAVPEATHQPPCGGGSGVGAHGSGKASSSDVRESTIGGAEGTDSDYVQGVLLNCFYGGSKQEWAAPRDTAVRLGAFSVYTSDSCHDPPIRIHHQDDGISKEAQTTAQIM